ncbi:WXG100 family type VII secretion target [Streptomyces chitinivorans]|uniref:WXG100 family type VII secretion target n=1 Tax=Streptomyces chitinivorans TaxID=1257027 RepID=A0ABW7HXF2_9ACTN|nr:WXG100 family type VII secretion target [Streptomyces chitinivorans]MDH2407447.1 WXG100 family type VII secretion target [Streptomyces chitinivorans]
MGGGRELDVSDEKLKDLASDLYDMGEYLAKKIKELNALVDGVDGKWRSSAAAAYKDLQRGVNDDAWRIQKALALIERGVEESRDGFTAQELDALQSFRRTLDSMEQPPEPTTARSRIADFAGAPRTSGPTPAASGSPIEGL